MKEGRDTQTSADGGSPNGESKSGLGRILEQARRDQGLTLEDVEQATKIRKRYLMGLEREEYAMLPDGVYARGFLKTYANYLGLDGEVLSQELRSLRKPRRERRSSSPQSDFGRPLITPGGVSGTEERKVPTAAILTLLAAVVVLAAIIGALYLVGRGVLITQATENPQPASADNAPDGSRQQEGQDTPSRDGSSEGGTSEGGTSDGGTSAGGANDPDPVNRTGTAESESRQAEGGTTVAEQSVPPDVLVVSVKVRERPSWLLIRADGSLAYEETASPGFTQTFEADRQLSITSGDAGAVTVEVNGQDAGVLGVPGDVVTRNFTLKSAS
ncbi:MAG: helix-turn-helix domain-containing protein [Rubrobacter sp.]